MQRGNEKVPKMGRHLLRAAPAAGKGPSRGARPGGKAPPRTREGEKSGFPVASASRGADARGARDARARLRAYTRLYAARGECAILETAAYIYIYKLSAYKLSG